MRPVNIFLHKLGNMLLLQVLIVKGRLTMSYLLKIGTSQLMGRITIMSLWRFSLHIQKLGKRLITFKHHKKWSQIKWILLTKVVTFLPTSPIPRIFNWLSYLSAATARHDWYWFSTINSTFNFSWTHNISWNFTCAAISWFTGISFNFSWWSGTSESHHRYVSRIL